MKVHKVALTDSMLYTRRIINLRINDVLIVPVFSLGLERMYVLQPYYAFDSWI